MKRRIRRKAAVSIASGKRNGFRRALLGAACAFACAPALAQAPVVEFQGAPNGLRDQLRAVSLLASGKREPATNAALRRMAQHDLEELNRALQSAGYYAGKANFTIEGAGEGAGEGADEDRRKVVFTIETGPRFTIADYVVAYEDETEGGDRPRSLGELDVKANGAADGASLQTAQRDFLTALWNKGYPAARMVGRRAEADLSGETARAVFTFESGPRATFGEIRVSGAEITEPDHLRKLKTWDEGELFDRSKLVSYRDRLSETGLFGGIDVSPGPPDETGAAPVLLDVEERKRRTIGAGLSYSTAEGPGGRLFFEYRNLFGRGELARVELEGSEVEQSLKFDLNKPLPAFPGSAYGALAFRNETTDAYDARTVEIGAGLSRKWLDDRLETRAGLAFESSKVRTVQSSIQAEQRTYLISTPLSAIWDTENNLLNPTRGVKASLTVTPYTGSDSFTVSELNARSRVNFGDEDRFTLAFRTRLGSIVGSSLETLPQNKRLYAGGGGSVRGYDFQAAGPLDLDQNPIGGRSVAEGAFEARARVVGNFQVAGFIDAATVNESSFPDFTGDYFVGVGGGLRYMTPVGPIRADIAFPLDKRESDRGFQLYISLGQPF